MGKNSWIYFMRFSWDISMRDGRGPPLLPIRGSLGERRKLPQATAGPGAELVEKRFWYIFSSKKTHDCNKLSGVWEHSYNVFILQYTPLSIYPFPSPVWNVNVVCGKLTIDLIFNPIISIYTIWFMMLQ